MNGTGNEIVDAISGVAWAGNVTPNAWYLTINIIGRRGERRPDLLAIAILSDILYWYRWREIRDEQTGLTVRYEKRFKRDRLHKRLADVAEQFGVSEKQARAALHRLRDAGLIVIDLEPLTAKGHVVGSNAMFISPVPSAIIAVTTRGGGSPQVTRVVTWGEGGWLPGGKEGGSPQGETYTESTNESTTKVNPPTPQRSSPETETPPGNFPTAIVPELDSIRESEPEDAPTPLPPAPADPEHGVAETHDFGQGKPERRAPRQAAAPTKIRGDWSAADLARMQEMFVEHFPKVMGGYGPTPGELALIATVPRARARELKRALRNYRNVQKGQKQQFNKHLKGWLTEVDRVGALYWEKFIADPVIEASERKILREDQVTPYEQLQAMGGRPAR